MSDLTDFLLARFAEDEEVARKAAAGSYVYDGPLEAGDDQDSHVVASPARVLAECEAKRRIVEEAALWGCQKTMCKILALPYADHPDWREEWRP